MRKPWFDDIPMGEIWVVPKRLRHAEQADAVVRIGGATAGQNHAGLDIQLRCSPTPEFAIVEVLYLWQFGPVLDAQLSREVLGYRLDLRQGELRKNSRWLFEYWPKRYEAFRRAPLRAALKELRRPGGSVVVLSADFAGYYDTIHSGFMLDEEFVDTLHLPSSGERSVATYRRATASLLNAQARFRADAGALTGEPWNAGIPIGPLTSRLVANLALSSFDQALSANQNLLCYRRYVDDMVVVARADKDAPVEFGEAVTSLIPRAQADGDTFTIEAAQLGRARCEFALQKKKMRVHHLSGIQGQTFIGAVAADFQRLVSERRAFLDPSALIEDTAKHMIRAGGGVGSPLRVLRDADRARLERFSLGTSLQSLERISALVNRREARTHVRATLDGVIRVLDSEDNWAENLDLLVRLLRLAVGTSDAESTTELLARMDALWGDVDALQRSTKKLFHRQREIHVPRAWVRLRNYLHERRHEALIDSLPPATPPSRLGDVLGTGLLVGTERVRASALLRRARLLAASDLRMRDREDDAFGPNARDSTSRDWMRGGAASAGPRREDEQHRDVPGSSSLGDRSVAACSRASLPLHASAFVLRHRAPLPREGRGRRLRRECVRPVARCRERGSRHGASGRRGPCRRPADRDDPERPARRAQRTARADRSEAHPREPRRHQCLLVRRGEEEAGAQQAPPARPCPRAGEGRHRIATVEARRNRSGRASSCCPNSRCPARGFEQSPPTS
jgi:hypothetical protein